MNEVPLGIRADGTDLSTTDAPIRVWSALVQKAQAPTLDVEGILDDFSDLHLLGATALPEMQEKMLQVGQDPEIWTGQYQRLKKSIAEKDIPQIVRHLEIASLLGMDGDWEDFDRNTVSIWIKQLKYSLSRDPQHVPAQSESAPEQIPPIDFEKEVEEIEGQVTARSIHGKFPPTVHIKDNVLHPWNLEFDSYGDDAALFDFKLPSYQFYMAIYYNMPIIRRLQLEYKNFVMSTNLPNTEEALLTYLLPVKWIDVGRRPIPFTSIHFRMPQETSQRLINLIRKNPDVAEMFLQKAATGFEEGIENYGISGIPRIRSDEIIIVNLDRFNPADLTPKIIGPYDDSGEGLNSRYRRVVDAALQNKNGEIEGYKYSTPHGILDPNQQSPYELVYHLKSYIARFGSIEGVREYYQKLASSTDRKDQEGAGWLRKLLDAHDEIMANLDLLLGK